MLDQPVTWLGQTISTAIRIEQAYPRIRQARLLVADDLPGVPVSDVSAATPSWT